MSYFSTINSDIQNEVKAIPVLKRRSLCVPDANRLIFLHKQRRSIYTDDNLLFILICGEWVYSMLLLDSFTREIFFSSIRVAAKADEEVEEEEDFDEEEDLGDDDDGDDGDDDDDDDEDEDEFEKEEKAEGESESFEKEPDEDWDAEDEFDVENDEEWDDVEEDV